MLGLLLNLGLCAHHNAAATGLIGLAHAVITVDYTACGEVGSDDYALQIGYLQLGIVEKRYARVDRVGKVVGRHVRSHTHRDARRTVHQDIRETGRKNQRLLAGIVVVGLEVHGIGVDVAHHLLAQRVEAHFGITHRRRRVAVDRTEVTVTVDQRVSQRPPLGHTDNRTVDRRVAVGVIVTHHLTDDFGRFLVRFVTVVAHLVHTEQHTAVHRLHAVTHIRQGTRHYH